MTKLHEAIESDNLEKCNEILTADSTQLLSLNAEGLTPVRFAIEKRRIKIAYCLLKRLRNEQTNPSSSSATTTTTVATQIDVTDLAERKLIFNLLCQKFINQDTFLLDKKNIFSLLYSFRKYFEPIPEFSENPLSILLGNYL